MSASASASSQDAVIPSVTISSAATDTSYESAVINGDCGCDFEYDYDRARDYDYDYDDLDTGMPDAATAVDDDDDDFWIRQFDTKIRSNQKREMIENKNAKYQKFGM